MDGFCGALTTVSTFVAELNGLRRMHAWMYGAASVVGGLAVMLVVMGSVRCSDVNGLDWIRKSL
jgi:CrcB protein